MKDGNLDLKPKNQTSEKEGVIKSRQRGEDDFRGKSDTPRGSEPEIRGASGRRG
jgi:hypothetical protein